MENKVKKGIKEKKLAELGAKTRKQPRMPYKLYVEQQEREKKKTAKLTEKVRN